MGRAYRLGQREVSVAETRARILNAARELLLGPDAMSTSMGDVAAAAGVTRQTIYQHFGSRSDLFNAMLNDALSSADVSGFLSALQANDALTAFRRGIVEGCRVWAAERAVFKQVSALAELDPGVVEVRKRRDDTRRRYSAFMVDRLAEAGLLRPGLSRDDAMCALESVTCFEAFDYLYTTRKLSLARATAIVAANAERALIAPSVLDADAPARAAGSSRR